MPAPTSAMSAFFGKETFEVIFMLGTIAMVGLLIVHSKGASEFVRANGETLANLFSVVTFQGQ